LQGQAGNAVQYVTRNQALKKLQLKLSEFRRLCILKGIHPREPKKKTQGSHKTYYHTKDIAYLLHEPLLKKVRELAAYDKKIRKATAKKNKDLAVRLASRRPSYRLDHLVRERYPSFVDALRDLDDPLTMIHLFAVLPADADHGIPTDRVHLARRLALEWQAWVVRAHALRKAFISVKGFYFQAEVQGQAVTWLVPHQTSQVLPTDVDFKVMLTFLELHQTTLQFVLYKLYHTEGLRYPPVVDTKLEEAAAGLQALMADLAAGPDALLVASGGSLTDGKKKNRRRGGKNNKPSGGSVDPEVTARLGTLSTKVAELEEEIKAMGQQAEDRRKAVAAENGDEEDADEEEVDEEGSDIDIEIDSGDEEDQEEEEEEEEEDQEEDDEEEEAPDPEDGDIIPTSVTGALPDASLIVGGATDIDSEDSAAVCAALFRGMVFFLGREVPREQLLLVIRSFGGDAGWAGEGSPLSEEDARITHHVIDRPAVGGIVYDTREYVQPQWLFDSANARVIVRAILYAPGKVPPPHLSPFVDAEAEGYMPEYGKEIKALQEAAKTARARAAGAAVEGAFLGADGVGAGIAGDNDDNKLGEEISLHDAEVRYAAELARELGKEKGGEHDEATVAVGSKRSREAAGGNKKNNTNQEDDEDAMEGIMMTRKVKRAYEKAKRVQDEKAARVEELETKAAKLKRKGAK
jgi:pescadillo protein